ncbi:MAG: DNA-directed RNA polymerase subunit beta', partial [Clostridia bacterium]|nr:DNA-directed RNA polymerase subunit beta' [Clostridia bacterium]
VDVSQDVIVREEDCGVRAGIVVSEIRNSDGNVLESFKERLVGRFTIDPILDPRPEHAGEVMVPAGELISESMAKKIEDAGVASVEVRSILRCRSRRGVCAHCYGADLASGKPVSIGEAVGVIAAQSIGEPGTQLTMRTFHTGGVAGTDITQGLPRVEELFEARRPKKTAVVAEADGTAHIMVDKKIHKIRIDVPGVPESQQKIYDIPFGMRLIIEEGAPVYRGQPMTEGALYPIDILETSGLQAAYDYIIREVQKVYRGEDVEINDKHIEVIARQMTRKVRIINGGDTDLLDGSVVDVMVFEAENDAVQARIDAGEISLRLAECKPELLGITKASLKTESFLSAASFQETTRVLTEAAIQGKVDHLLGLKENVIIGKLIPAGTGLDFYHSVEIEEEAEEDDGDKYAVAGNGARGYYNA